MMTIETSPNLARGESHVPALDGLRGIAILLVILFHHTLLEQVTVVDRVYANVARFGWVGVDLFFVLSGYLITGILYDAKGGSHYFRNFYVRRALRIVPVYYAFLFFTLVLAPAWWPDGQVAEMYRSAFEDRSPAWYWLYLSNVLAALDEGFLHANLAVTWSLAIEEQFYLVWPLMVFFSGRRALIWTSLALVAGALAARTFLVMSGTEPIAVYVLPFCRMDALAVGAAVALAVRDEHDRRGVVQLARWTGPVSAFALVALWIAEGPLDDGSWTEPGMQTAGYMLLAILFGSLVAAIVADPDRRRLRRVLEARWLATWGKYSYALYLLHVPVRRYIRDTWFPVASFPSLMGSPLPGQVLFYIAATVPAFALAWLSWHVLEAPVLKLKRFFPR